MLRTTPTHIVEIGTNLNSTKSSAPFLQQLQHHHLHHQTTAAAVVASATAAAAAASATAAANKYQYHGQYSNSSKSSPLAAVTNNKQQQKTVYQLQTTSKKSFIKLKKTKKSSSSSTSSNSSTNTSISSTTSDESTRTSSTTPLTFKEHFLSRGLLSVSPFAFMRLRKANKANNTGVGHTELRKKSQHIVDFVDCHNSQQTVQPQGATAKETSASEPAATVVDPAAGYFANKSFRSSNNTNNSNNSTNNIVQNKNTYNNSHYNNNNNNNNYITSYSTTTSITSVLKVNDIKRNNFKSGTISEVTNSVNTKSPTTTLPFLSITNTVVAPPTLVAVAVASPPIATTTSMSPTSQTPPAARTSLFDSCHRKIRLIGGGPVAFLGGLVAKARRKERDGDQNSTDTKLYLEESVLERKLPEADLKALVDLPAGLDYNEWLASHTLALFEHVNLVYGTISEFCTTTGCPDMTGPANRTYLWFDEKGKKTRVAAPQYIDYVMTFTQKTVSDESIFPTKYANEFPSSFESIARKILRLQFHVIAHLYAAHFREIALLGLHTHLNLTFAHLTALHRRFNLIDEKETDVLRDLEVALRLTDDTSNQSGGGSGGGAGGSSSGGGGSASSGNAGAQGEGTADAESGKHEDVNSVQHNNTAPLIDGICGGGGNGPPICTQPEAGLKSQQFGGGGGLIGGILGDLSSGEFGDTMHYCTSAVPASSSTTCSLTNPLQNSTATTCNATNGGNGVDPHTPAGVTANGNNGAGALHFYPQHNNSNHVAHHHHQHPHHHHAHHHHHHHPNHHYAQNTGLIQCNASNAPTATAATTSTTTA